MGQGRALLITLVWQGGIANGGELYDGPGALVRWHSDNESLFGHGIHLSSLFA